MTAATDLVPARANGRLRLLLVTTILGLSLVASPALTRSAAAGEVYPVPPSGTWPVNGAGFGHGIGLSQWGAQGAALQGLRWDQILGFYYPGATLGWVGTPQIRVQLTAYSGSSLVFGRYGSEQLVATDAATGASQTLPAANAYLMTIDASGMYLGYWTAQGWSSIAFNGSYAVAGPIDVSGPSGTWLYSPDLSGAGRQYWGMLRLVRTGLTSAQAVNILPLEAYLRGVVPREVPSSWHANALRAQAVAARSYALAVSSPGLPWDICDTTQCQVYGGRAVAASGQITWLEASSTSTAVGETTGVVMNYGAGVAFTQFSSSNGGYSVAGSKPYLVAQPDPYTGVAPGDTASRWTAQLAVATLQPYCPSGGSVSSFEITGRDGKGPFGGRITAVRINCNTGSATVSGSTARFGMKSNMWQPAVPPGWSPAGHVDLLSAGVGTIRIAGWALDPDTIDPIEVHVYVDGGGHNLGPAAFSRPDIGAAYPGYGNLHGFDATIWVGSGTHSVCVHAINAGPGAHTLLLCTTVSVSANPAGNAEVVAPVPSAIRVAGWALDPDTVSPIEIHVYINSGGYNLGPTPLSRPDVAATYPGYGAQHGFDTTIWVGPGARSVCIYAINTGPGVHTLLRCATLVVP